MIKCEVIKKFSLKKFNELKKLVRATSRKDEGRLFIGDVFECDKEMADYLTGNNIKKDVVVKILEVIPEEKITASIATNTYLDDTPIRENKIKEIKKTSKKKKKD